MQIKTDKKKKFLIPLLFYLQNIHETRKKKQITQIRCKEEETDA